MRKIKIPKCPKCKRRNIMKIENIHSDDRGFIKAITSDELVYTPEVTVLHTKAGMSRGGCVHHKSREHLCVIEGVIYYVYGTEKEPQHMQLHPGQSITIEPHIPHYFVALTNSIVIEFGPAHDEKQEKYAPFRTKVLEINEAIKKNT